MSDTTSTTRTPSATEAELLGRLSDQTAQLVRQELRLAELEHGSRGRAPDTELPPEVAGRTTAGQHEPASADDEARRADARAPDELGELPRRDWIGVLKRAGKEFSADHLTDQAGALTYYGVLAIFPMLIVLISVLGLIGNSVTQPLIHNLSTVAPNPARSVFTSAIRNIQARQGTAGVLFVVGLVGALWSASGYVAAFMRASNVVWDVEEGRPIYKTLPIRLGVTLITVILLTIAALAVVVTGSLASRVGHLIGVGDTAVTAWDIAKWPAMVAIMALVLSILYFSGPNVRQPGFRWVTPGSVFAVVTWIVASGLFALYVGNFGSYNKTYGALGGVVAFLVWMWITNLVILFGAELNAELARGRQMRAGLPEDAEPYLPHRDLPKH